MSKQDLDVGNVIAESITVKHPEGKSSVTLMGTPNGAGIWISQDASDRIIAIYTLEDQTAIGIYGPGRKNLMNIAISVDDDGRPTLQLTAGADQVPQIVDLLDAFKQNTQPVQTTQMPPIGAGKHTPEAG